MKPIVQDLALALLTRLKERGDRPLNDAEHGRKTPCGDNTGERTAQFPH